MEVDGRPDVSAAAGGGDNATRHLGFALQVRTGSISWDAVTHLRYVEGMPLRNLSDAHASAAWKKDT